MSQVARSITPSVFLLDGRCTPWTTKKVGLCCTGWGRCKACLPLQNVSYPLTVKQFNLFNESMEVITTWAIHGSAYSHSVMTTKRVYSYRLLENTPRFKKIYPKCDLLKRALSTVYVVAGAGSDRRRLHVPSMLQFVQAPTDGDQTCRLCCSLRRLRLTNTTRAFSAAACAGYRTDRT